MRTMRGKEEHALDSVHNAMLEKQARMEEQIRGIYMRLDEQKELTESVHKLAISLERLTTAQKSTADKVDTLSNDVEELKTRPAKKWDGATTVVITAIITAVLTFIFTRIGLK